MKNKIRTFIFLFLFIPFLTANLFAQTSVSPPKVTKEVTFWQNCSKPLFAIPSPGGTLNWYATSNGGTALPSAPTPNTSIVGSTVTYYVTQTIGGNESSPRTPIVVKVAVDNGQIFPNLSCDKSQIPKYSSQYTPPLTVNNCVFFEWSPNTLLPDPEFRVIYTLPDGTIKTDDFIDTHYIVPNLLPGQSIKLEIYSKKFPCKLPQQQICSVPCGTITDPTFDPLSPYCLNDIVNLPKISKNLIEGIWNPSSVDTSTFGTKQYEFIPDPIKFPCASKTTKLSVTVAPAEPDFTDLNVCFGDIPPNLETESPNGIKGTWLPSSIDNTTSSSYDFTPDAGQPCTPTKKTIFVTIRPSNTIVSSDFFVSDAFIENQIVNITDPIGANFVYQLDSGPYQSSPIFENVSYGTHSITVNDIYGCSPYTKNVLIIKHPKYFTPNGDGYNDTWKIDDLSKISITKIYIFDRYGKLLKEISADGTGWDGTYLGVPMPADDYWFTVDYLENLTPKKFKSHFSLKR